MSEKTNKPSGISRRSLLKTGAAAAGAALGSGAITGFPTIWAQNPITLRQIGTGVSNINAIAQKCKEDLGITLEMTALDSDSAAQRAVTQPNSYDIADIEYWILKKVFPAGVIQPMDTKKLTYYDKIVPLFKTGKLTPDSVIAQGYRAAHRWLCGKQGCQDLCQERDRMVHHGPDHLQRRTRWASVRTSSAVTSPPGPTFSIRPSRARLPFSTSRPSASWMQR